VSEQKSTSEAGRRRVIRPAAVWAESRSLKTLGACLRAYRTSRLARRSVRQ
jgi:hypothetical protein